MRAIAINCSLKREEDKVSSTHQMIELIGRELGKEGVSLTDTIRLAPLNLLPGVSSDEGKGDEWPEVRRRILDHDILVFGTPIWLGQPSSIAKRVLERMDAFLGEADDQGHYPPYGKVALTAIVGNEDGAHHVTAELFQALNDVGWTIPANGSCYWVGEAMQSIDFKDLEEVPEKVQQTAAMVARNAAHVARLLKEQSYPAKEGGHGKPE
jgi:multimeric flavodoxin WrbA